MDAKQIIREHLDAVNQSKIIGIFMADQETLQSEMELAVRDIARFSANPPEPPKTVLPDMSNAEMGKTYWFFGEDGTKVAYERDDAFDGIPWYTPNSISYSAEGFIACHPHLGRLRRAVPGEVAE